MPFTGEYKDEDIVKFIQGEQLALLTKFSDEVSVSHPSIVPFFLTSFLHVIMATNTCGLASIITHRGS